MGSICARSGLAPMALSADAAGSETISHSLPAKSRQPQ